MTRGSIREYVEAVRRRYFLASKKEKGKILDEFTKKGCMGYSLFIFCVDNDTTTLQISRSLVDWLILFRVITKMPYLDDEAVRLRVTLAEVAVPGIYPELRETISVLHGSCPLELSPTIVRNDQPVHAVGVEVEVTLSVLELQLPIRLYYSRLEFDHEPNVGWAGAVHPWQYIAEVATLASWYEPATTSAKAGIGVVDNHHHGVSGLNTPGISHSQHRIVDSRSGIGMALGCRITAVTVTIPEVPMIGHSGCFIRVIVSAPVKDKG